MKFMDMLYSRYAYPMDLINTYINRGRFGEFVQSFLEAEAERRKADIEKDDELKLWIMYCHLTTKGFTDESYRDWKARILGTDNNGKKIGKDADLTDEGIQAIIADIFPE